MMNYLNGNAAGHQRIDLLNDIINHLNEGVLVFDENGNVLFCNEQASNLVGLTEQELKERNFFELLYIPDTDETLVAASQTALKKIQLFGGKINDADSYLYTNYIDLLPIKYNMAPLQHVDHRGNTVFTFWDNSKQKKFEQRLKKQTSQLKRRTRQLNQAQQRANIGSWEWNLKKNTIVWTDELYRLHGYEPGGVKVDLDLVFAHIHPNDSERINEILSESQKVGGSFQYQSFIYDADAHLKRVEVYGLTTLDDNGEPLMMRGTAQDITHVWKQAEQLRRSELLFRTIFEGSAIGILHLAINGTVLKVNPAAVDIFGQSAQQLQNKQFDELLGQRENRRFQSLFQTLVEGKISQFQLDTSWQNGESKWRWTNLIVSTLPQFHGEPLRAVAMVEDITVRKQMEQELRAVKRRLSQSREKVQLRFAQDLHDGPIQDLYAATFHLQALRRMVQEEAAEKTIDLVQTMFKQVSDTLRIMCRELRPPTLKTFGLQTAIRSHVDQFTLRYPDLSIQVSLDDDGQILTEFLRLSLYRMVQELLNNIAKHAQATKVLIRFSLNDDAIVLEVQDNGIGFEVPERWIDLAEAGHLGLVGLAERVDDVNGRLQILSTPNRGTLVRIQAPKAYGEGEHE